MEIAELDVTDVRQLEELFAVRRAAHAADCPDNPPPLWDQHVAEFRTPHPEGRMERVAARVDGRIVGDGLLGLPDVDHRHLAGVDAQVHPEYRRRGIGRALLDQLRTRARDERRRTLMAEQVIEPVPGGPVRDGAGAQFLAATGFSRALTHIARRIDLSAVDEKAEQRLLDECRPHATEYEVVSWTGLTPDQLASGVAYLANRIMTDAPMGDADLGELTLDADRLQASERWWLDRRRQLVVTAARHRATGTVAAVTGVRVRSAGDHGDVWITIADPRHRGHRLGTIVKIENHRQLRQRFPGLRYVQTGNADTNTYMAAINERLGFVPYQLSNIYQLG